MSENPEVGAGSTGPNPVEDAMRLMEIAMNTLSPEERKTVIQLKKEVDEAAQQAGETSFDKRLEFCYAVKFSQDKIKSTRMLHAVESYIRAVEG